MGGMSRASTPYNKCGSGGTGIHRRIVDRSEISNEKRISEAN
jgi:hypothetical protein